MDDASIHMVGSQASLPRWIRGAITSLKLHIEDRCSLPFSIEKSSKAEICETFGRIPSVRKCVQALIRDPIEEVIQKDFRWLFTKESCSSLS